MMTARCQRCQGLMVAEPTSALLMEDDARLFSPGMHLVSWRCVNCGEWRDHQVTRNRLAPNGQAEIAPRPRVPLVVS